MVVFGTLIICCVQQSRSWSEQIVFAPDSAELSQVRRLWVPREMHGFVDTFLGDALGLHAARWLRRGELHTWVGACKDHHGVNSCLKLHESPLEHCPLTLWVDQGCIRRRFSVPSCRRGNRSCPYPQNQTYRLLFSMFLIRRRRRNCTRCPRAHARTPSSLLVLGGWSGSHLLAAWWNKGTSQCFENLLVEVSLWSDRRNMPLCCGAEQMRSHLFARAHSSSWQEALRAMSSGSLRDDWVVSLPKRFFWNGTASVSLPLGVLMPRRWATSTWTRMTCSRSCHCCSPEVHSHLALHCTCCEVLSDVLYLSPASLSDSVADNVTHDHEVNVLCLDGSAVNGENDVVIDVVAFASFDRFLVNMRVRSPH